MTPEQLAQGFGIRQSRAEMWAGPLTIAAREFNITLPDDLLFWLANVGHESGLLQWTEEIWGPTLAQSRYDDREDLGNTNPIAKIFAAAKGDLPGHFYRGYGLIQITGYETIHEWSMYRFSDDRATRDPSIIRIPANAAHSAAWFWVVFKGLSPVAQLGTPQAFKQCVVKVNGGVNGMDERLRLWELLKKAFSSQ